MPFRKDRNAIINKKQRKPRMKRKGIYFKHIEHYGKVKKARSKYEEKLEPEDIDSIPGIETIGDNKDEKNLRKNSNSS